MRREQDNITRTALHWTPEGKRKRGRPRNSWRRTVEAELKTMHHTWGTFRSSPGTDRGGDPSQPPYVPHGIKAWVSVSWKTSGYSFKTSPTETGHYRPGWISVLMAITFWCCTLTKSICCIVRFPCIKCILLQVWGCNDLSMRRVNQMFTNQKVSPSETIKARPILWHSRASVTCISHNHRRV